MSDQFNKSQVVNIKSVDEAEGTISAYLTTYENQDVVNDIISKGALDEFINGFNPKVKKLPMLLGHDHSAVIGEWVGLKSDDYGVIGEGVIYTETTQGSDVHKLMKRDALSSVSIGFRSSDYEVNDFGGLTFKEISLVETSVVLFPANDQALVTSVKSDDGLIEVKALKNHLKEGGLSKAEVEALFLEGWKGLTNLRKEDADLENLLEKLQGFKL